MPTIIPVPERPGSETIHYRGYGLQVMPSEGAWQVFICPILANGPEVGVWGVEDVSRDIAVQEAKTRVDDAHDVPTR